MREIIVTKEVALNHVLMLKEKLQSQEYENCVTILDLLSEIENKITKSQDHNSEEFKEKYKAFAIIKLIVNNFYSQEQCFQEMQDLINLVLTMIGETDELEKERIKKEVKSFVKIYQIALEQRLSIWPRKSFFVLAFLHSFVVNIQICFSSGNNDIHWLDKNNEEILDRYKKIGLSALEKHWNSFVNFSQKINNICFYLLLCDSKNVNLQKIAKKISDIYTFIYDDLMEIEESKAIGEEFIQYFKMLMQKGRSIFEKKTGAKMLYLIDESVSKDNDKFMNLQSVLGEGLTNVRIINDEQLGFHNLNIHYAVMLKIESLLKNFEEGCFFVENGDLSESAINLKKDFAILTEKMDKLFFEKSMDTAKYVYLKPILIYIDLIFKENCFKGEIPDMENVESIFLKKVQNIKIDVFVGCMSFAKVLHRCFLIVLNYGYDKSQVFISNYQMQESLSYLYKYSESDFPGTMTKIFDAFHHFFKAKVKNFSREWLNFENNRDAEDWISKRLIAFRKMQKEAVEYDGNERFDQSAFKETSVVIEELGKFFEENKNSLCKEMLEVFEVIYDMEILIRKIFPDTMHKYNYSSLFEKSIWSILSLLKKINSKQVVFSKEEDLGPVVHYLYRLVFIAINRVTFIEIESKKNGNNKKSSHKNKKNILPFSLELKKNGLFHVFLEIAVKDEHHQDVIAKTIDAFAVLIVKKSEWNQYSKEDVGIFKVKKPVKHLEIINKKKSGKKGSDEVVRNDMIKNILEKHFPKSYEKIVQGVFPVIQKFEQFDSENSLSSIVQKKSKKRMSKSKKVKQKSKDESNVRQEESTNLPEKTIDSKHREEEQKLKEERKQIIGKISELIIKVGECIDEIQKEFRHENMKAIKNIDQNRNNGKNLNNLIEIHLQYFKNKKEEMSSLIAKIRDLKSNKCLVETDFNRKINGLANRFSQFESFLLKKEKSLKNYANQPQKKKSENHSKLTQESNTNNKNICGSQHAVNDTVPETKLVNQEQSSQKNERSTNKVNKNIEPPALSFDEINLKFGSEKLNDTNVGEESGKETKKEPEKRKIYVLFKTSPEVQKLKKENAQLLQQVEMLSEQLDFIQYGGVRILSLNNDGYYVRGLFYPYDHLNDFSSSSTSFDSDSEQSKTSNQNILDSKESENGSSDNSLQFVPVISTNPNTLCNEINKRQSEEKKEKQGEEYKDSHFLENQQN